MNVSRTFQYPLFVFVGLTDKNMRFCHDDKISVLRGIKLFYDIFFYKDSLFGESVCISIECYITQKAA